MEKNGIIKTDVIVEESLENEINSDNTRKSTENLENNVSGRDHRGRFKAGNTFSVGRPKKERTIVEKFRANPKGLDLIQNIFKIASSLGTKKQHKDAMNCAKLVVERLIPTLKSSELKIDSENDSGFVFLPPQSEPESEE